MKNSERPATIVLTLVGIIDDAQTAHLCSSLRASLEPDGNEVVTCDTRQATACFGLVGALARLQLTARQYGNTIRIVGARRELTVLIHLAGLAGVLPMAGGDCSDQECC